MKATCSSPTYRERAIPAHIRISLKRGTNSRQCVYISREVQEKIADIVHTLGRNKTTIGAYIDKVLCEHLEMYRAEINDLYFDHYLLRKHI